MLRRSSSPRRRASTFLTISLKSSMSCFELYLFADSNLDSSYPQAPFVHGRQRKVAADGAAGSHQKVSGWRSIASLVGVTDVSLLCSAVELSR
jgi:hypothetical protein